MRDSASPSVWELRMRGALIRLVTEPKQRRAGVCVNGKAGVQAAHQDHFGVQYIAQGCFDMQLGEPQIQTSNLPNTEL